MDGLEVRHRISRRPKTIRSGELAYVAPSKLIVKRDEIALTLGLITDRHLFGRVYSGLQPDYFYSMPQNSGVYICPFVKTDQIFPGIFNPGDIDLLIIPYEENDLVLDRILAIEVKVIRAAFKKQGKSPNEFGFSQASALKAIGFPYVAVAHLVFSDESSQESWREMSVAKVLDDFGRCQFLPNQNFDWLPIDLIKRAFGRLRTNAINSEFGLSSIYIGSRDEHIFDANTKQGTWLPNCRAALCNDGNHSRVFGKVSSFFDRFPDRFLDNPRFDPMSFNTHS